MQDEEEPLMGKSIFSVLIATGVMVMGCSQEPKVIKNYSDIEYVKAQTAKLAPVEISYDKSLLTPDQQQALFSLVKAARYIDQIFIQQVYVNNEQIAEELQTGRNPDFPVLMDYFKVNFGPFDRLDNNRPFIDLHEPKPAGANFYPADMTKDEFQTWITEHPQDEAAFTGNFTVIRRKDHGLVALDYSQAYKKELTAAADLLKDAAGLLKNVSLKKYLISRAEAFLTNDYYQSDMDWMDLKDHTLEVVIGPYEVYEDQLFGYKASFEAFITVVDPVESEKLHRVGQFLDEMENNLPIPAEYRNTRRGSSSPIVVVHEVFTAGDTKAGVQTTAFNLPNDERVREAKGSKKVMLKNVARAKFEKCWIPIVGEVMAGPELPFITFDAYFNHVLMHEMSHGLGPGIITREDRETSVSKELKETYPTIEEAKADILGIYNTLFLINKGFLPDTLKRQTFSTFLGGIFRSVRFGISSAHGGANAIEYNYVKEKGGFLYDPSSGKFRVNTEKIERAVQELAKDLLFIQARGDYAAANAFIEKYRYLPEEIENALLRLEGVPVDIRPSFAIEKEIFRE